MHASMRASMCAYMHACLDTCTCESMYACMHVIKIILLIYPQICCKFPNKHCGVRRAANGGGVGGGGGQELGDPSPAQNINMNLCALKNTKKIMCPFL